MEIRVLKNFLIVAHENSISKAADVIHISQSALSRQMMELEEELNTQLFIRKSRSTELTSDGLRFKERVQSIVDLSDRTLFEFSHTNEEIQGDLTICLENEMACKLLSEAITAVHEKHKKIRFAFISSGTEASLTYLEEGICDLAVIREPFDKERYEYITLKKEKLGILTRKDSPYAQLKSVDEKQISDLKLFVFHQFINPRYSMKPNVSRGKMNIIGNYTSLDSVIPLVQNNTADALCVSDENTADYKDLVFIPITPLITHEIVLARRKHHILSKAAEAFLTEVRNIYD